MDYDKLDYEVKFYSMASYLGPLFILGRLSKRRQNKNIDFHSWQGGILFFMVLFLRIVVLGAKNFLFLFPTIAEMSELILNTGVWTFWGVLSIMGLVNAYKMERKRLPFIGWIDIIMENHYKFINQNYQ